MTEPTAQELEYQIYELTQQLNEKRKLSSGVQVKDYSFKTDTGTQPLSSFLVTITNC